MTAHTKRATGATTKTVVEAAPEATAGGPGGRGAVGDGGGGDAPKQKRRVSQAVHARDMMRKLRSPKSTIRVWSKAPIRRRLRKAAEQQSGAPFNIKKRAMEILMEHLETWCTKRFSWAHTLALHADHVTVRERDLELAFQILKPNGKAPLFWNEAEYAKIDAMMPSSLRIAKLAADRAAAKEAGLTLRAYRKQQKA